MLFSQLTVKWQAASRFKFHIDENGWTFLDNAEDTTKNLVHVPYADLEAGIDLSETLSTRSRLTGVEICLSSELGLSRSVELPQAARANLGDILRYDLDRLTPYSADDVHMDFRVEKSMNDGKNIEIALAVISKTVIERVASLAKKHQIAIKCITLEGDEKFDFSRFVPSSPKRLSSRLKWCGVPALLAFVLSGLIGLQIHHQGNKIKELDKEISSLHIKAEAHSTRRRLLDEELTATQDLENVKESRVKLTQLLAELTRLVPDSAFLVQLVVDGDSVQFYGLAENASTLITALEQSTVFHAPRFDSPVTMDNKAGREQFHLTAKITQAAE